MVKKLLNLILSLVFVLLLCTPSFAIFGVGDLVFDTANSIHDSLRDITDSTRWVSEYAEYVTQTYYQLSQVQNQIKQIQYQIQSLNNIDASSLGNLYNSFNGTISTLRSIDSNIVGLTMTYKDIDNKYDDLYASYDKLKNFSTDKQVKVINNIQKQIIDANKNAMRAQSINDKMKESLTQLQYLQSKNMSATGLLESTQIANEIAIRNTAEVIRLQDIMAQSMRAITSINEAERVRGDLAKIDNQRFTTHKPINMEGKSKGLIKLSK